MTGIGKYGGIAESQQSLEHSTESALCLFLFLVMSAFMFLIVKDVQEASLIVMHSTLMMWLIGQCILPSKTARGMIVMVAGYKMHKISTKYVIEVPQKQGYDVRLATKSTSYYNMCSLSFSYWNQLLLSSSSRGISLAAQH